MWNQRKSRCAGKVKRDGQYRLQQERRVFEEYSDKQHQGNFPDETAKRVRTYEVERQGWIYGRSGTILMQRGYGAFLPTVYE